jgi:hypothetical protein
MSDHLRSLYSRRSRLRVKLRKLHGIPAPPTHASFEAFCAAEADLMTAIAAGEGPLHEEHKYLETLIGEVRTHATLGVLPHDCTTPSARARSPDIAPYQMVATRSATCPTTCCATTFLDVERRSVPL